MGWLVGVRGSLASSHPNQQEIRAETNPINRIQLNSALGIWSLVTESGFGDKMGVVD